jgi:hypothetical protein
MINDLFPGFVVYGECIVGDWTGSGRPTIFSNTPITGFGLVDATLRTKWFTDRANKPRNCIGAIARVAEKGSDENPGAHKSARWLFGTLSGGEFQTYDMRDGRLVQSERVDIDPGDFGRLYCADLDNDGQEEFLTATAQEIVCLKAGSTPGPRIKWRMPLPTAASQPIIADADSDGWLDLLYTGADGCVHILGAP